MKTQTLKSGLILAKTMPVEERPFIQRKEVPMRRYLFYGSYTPKGYKGLLAEGGSARIGAAKQALQSVGGSLETFYYSNGEQDFYIIVSLPDDVCSTAITLAGNASGTFRIHAVPLLTPEEMDKAVKMKVDFRPPGQGGIEDEDNDAT